MKKNDQQSMRGDTGFGMGFFCGALLGALGVYVSVVPEGKRLKARFLKEFEAYKAAMEQGKNEESKTIADVRALIAKIKQAINPQPGSAPSKSAATAGHSSKKKHYFKAKP